jgi:hypothetical protein
MEYDMTEFHQMLTDAPEAPAKEDFFNYGITVYFLNGPN